RFHQFAQRRAVHPRAAGQIDHEQAVARLQPLARELRQTLGLLGNDRLALNFDDRDFTDLAFPYFHLFLPGTADGSVKSVERETFITISPPRVEGHPDYSRNCRQSSFEDRPESTRCAPRPTPDPRRAWPRYAAAPNCQHAWSRRRLSIRLRESQTPRIWLAS